MPPKRGRPPGKSVPKAPASAKRGYVQPMRASSRYDLRVEVEAGSNRTEDGPNGETFVLTNEHFASLRNADVKRLFPHGLAGAINACANACDKTPFNATLTAKTVEEFYAMVENFEVLKVFATLHLNTLGGPDLNTIDRRGWTLLHRLAQSHCNEIHPLCAVIWMCVKQGRCDVRICDSQGRTPLHLAVIAENECAVKAFLELLSPVNTVDAYKRTPLISAIATGKVDFVKRLLFGGASFTRVDAYLTAQGDQIPKNIRDLVISHRTRLCNAMNSARKYIFPQAVEGTNGAVEGAKVDLLSTVLISPIFEKDKIDYTFKLNDPKLKPNNYLPFEHALLEMNVDKDEVSIRMWQQSPVKSIIINNEEPVKMHKTSNYISLPKLVNGRNQVNIELKNQMYQGTRYCIITRLAHVCILNYHPPSRMEPTLENLLPLSAGNPPPGQAKQMAPQGIKALAESLRPRYYKDPAELPPPPPPPLQPAVQPIRRVLPATRSVQTSNTATRILPIGANQRVATGPTRVMQPSLRPATRLVFTPRTPTQPQSAPRYVMVSRTLPPNVVVRSNAPPQSPMPQQLPPHARPSRQKTPGPPRIIRNLSPNVEVRPNSPPLPMPQEQPRVTPFQQAPARPMANLRPNVIRRPSLTSQTCNSTVGHQNLNPPPRLMFPGSTFVTVTDPIEKVRLNQPTRHRSMSPQPGPPSATRPTVTPYHPLHFQPPRRQRQQPPTPSSESRPNPGVFRSSRF